MAFVFVLADAISVAKDIAGEINSRLDASKNLGTYCRDLRTLVMQVVDLLDTLPDNSSVATGINATNDLLKDILIFIKEDENFAETAGCCSLFIHAKDYQGDVLQYEERMRKQVTLLTQLVTIKGVQDSVGGIIKNADARKFWIQNFGDRDRSVPWQLMADSFKSRFDAREDHLVELKEALLEHQDLGGSHNFADLRVSVFKFDSVFREGSVEATVQSFLQEAKDKKRVWHIVLRDPTTKIEMDVDAGFVLIPDSGSLSVVRSSIVAELQEDEDLPGELEFLTTGKGQFNFFLDGGKSRVKKNQEGAIRDSKKVDQACIIPDKEGVQRINEEIKNGAIIDGYSGIQNNDAVIVETKATDGGPSSFATFKIVQKDAGSISKSQVAPAPSPAMEEDVAEIDQGLMNLKASKIASQKLAAEGISIEDVLSDENLMHQFKKVLQKMGIDEANADFLQKMSQTLNATSLSDQQKLRDIGNGENLLLSRATAQRMQMQDNGGNNSTSNEDAHEQLLKMQDDVMANLSEGALDELKKTLKKAPRTRLGKGKGKKVVVIGGGTGGSIVAGALQIYAPDVSIILIDQKEYLEVTPSVPSAMVMEGRWDKIALMHDSYLRTEDKQDQLIIGRVVCINSDHVLVGSNKQVVPFDYCVNVSGSRYTSDIKTDNITMGHRRQRMAKERENIKSCERVVCIGGGLVGVELASDIKDEFPDKDVTIIHRNSKLLPRIEAAHPLLMEHMNKVGIKTRLNKAAMPFQFDEDNRGYFPIVSTGGGGDEARAPEMTSGPLEDLDNDNQDDRLYVEGTRVYWCTGYTPNTAHVKAGPFASQLDDSGFCKADEYLRIPGTENIFVGGDCLEAQYFVNRERTSHYAALHAIAIATNITKSIEEEPLAKFVPPPDAKDNFILCELGKTDAVMVLPQAYDGMLAYFGEGQAAVEALLKPQPAPAGSMPARIGLIPGAGAFKMGFMDQLCGMYSGGPDGMKALIEMEQGVAGMVNVMRAPKGK